MSDTKKDPDVRGSILNLAELAGWHIVWEPPTGVTLSRSDEPERVFHNLHDGEHFLREQLRDQKLANVSGLCSILGCTEPRIRYTTKCAAHAPEPIGGNDREDDVVGPGPDPMSRPLSELLEEAGVHVGLIAAARVLESRAEGERLVTVVNLTDSAEIVKEIEKADDLLKRLLGLKDVPPELVKAVGEMVIEDLEGEPGVLEPPQTYGGPTLAECTAKHDNSAAFGGPIPPPAPRRDALLALHDELTARAKAIMVAKNHDYTSNSDDPYANFRGSEFVNVHPVLGILMRSMDKFKRIQSYVEQGKLEVAGESIEDAVLDVMNYQVLLLGFIRDLRRMRDVGP